MTLPAFVTQIKSRVEKEFKKNLYRNLVFKGGGVRGIAYMGALEVLEEEGILDNIERVAGASAGAIAAALVSFRLSAHETKQLFLSLDINRVPQASENGKTKSFLLSDENACTRRFFERYGWYSSQYFYHWMENVIGLQCEGNRRATFTDFKRYGFRDLYIVAANLSRQRTEVFSAETTPDVAVADAVRMSMSIPLYFEAVRFDGKQFGDGDFYVDGGVYDNFPTHIFDKPAYANWAFRDGINWETLGLFLRQEEKDGDVPEIPDDVWQFLTLAARNLYHSHQVSAYQNNPVDKHRTIEISDCGISSLDFDIEPGSEKHELLYSSGRDAVRAFFDLVEDEPALKKILGAARGKRRMAHRS